MRLRGPYRPLCVLLLPSVTLVPEALAPQRAAAYHQIVDSNECPANPEEIAEACVMGTLRKEQVIAFEDHYVTGSQ